MLFKNLKLQDFGPYKGEQTIAFANDPGSRLTVIFGDNMRGKTSLLNAVRWVLYGKALDRGSRPMDLIRLLNKESRNSGEYSFSVTVEFEGEGQQYVLRRSAKPKEMIAEPRSTKDFDVGVLLQIDGASVENDRIEAQINQLIPEEISRFHLFDGELLQEYELLVSEESSQGKKIKVAIEQVLGVPALIKAREGLKVLLRKAQSLQAKELKHVKALEAQADQSARLKVEIEAHEADLALMHEKLEGLSSEVSAIDEELSGYAQIEEHRVRLLALDAEVRQRRELEKELQSQLHNALGVAWRDLLRPRFRIRQETIARQVDAYQDQVKRTGVLEHQVESYRKLLQSGACSVCGSKLSDDRANELAGQMGLLEAQLEDVTIDGAELARLTAEMGQVNKFILQTAGGEIASVDKQITLNAVKGTALETEIEEIRDRLRGHDITEIARLQKKKEGLNQIVGKHQQRIDDLRTHLDSKTDKYRELSKIMSKAPGARSQRSTREVEVYDALEQVFDASIERLRDRLRAKVETNASTVFHKLTTEKTYQDLTINRNYGLTIIDRMGDEVSVRSAGAEQVVAMSLLSALNSVSSRSAPVIVDTPFGRLDPKHRLNILKHIPGMADQVVFLVHGGEIDPEDGLEPIASHVGATYEIERVSSSHSRLVRRQQ